MSVFESKEDKRYYNDLGDLHRIGGPAIEFATGRCDWYYKGIQINKEIHDLISIGLTYLRDV